MDFSDLGGQQIDFSDLGGERISDKEKLTLKKLAAMGSRAISSMGNALTETAIPPRNAEQLSRLMNPNAGRSGVSRLMENAGNRVTSAADVAVKNLPPLAQAAYRLRPGDLTPSSIQQQIGTAPIAEGASSVAGRVLKPILAPVGRGIANVMERTSGLTYKTPGVLAEAFNDSGLQRSPGMAEVRPAYKAAKAAAGGVANLVSGEESPALINHKEIIDKALEMAKAGNLNPAEAQTARMSVDALGDSGSYSDDSIRGLRSYFDKIAKSNKGIAAGDKAFQRAIKADALREAFPVNKLGGTSIMKLVTGVGATKFLGPGGIAIDAALLSPAVQGSLATGAGMATRAIGSTAASTAIGNAFRDALKRRKQNARP